MTLEIGTCFHGEAVAMLGQVSEGIAQMRGGMAVNKSLSVRCNILETVRALAEAQAKAGQPERGLTTLVEALTMVAETGERHWEAEVYRLRGELLLTQGDEAKAEASYHKAIEVARRQSAKSWELRVSIGLARLWHKQGKTNEAQQLLGEIYSWFTEGFDTPDLKEAAALLEELS